MIVEIGKIYFRIRRRVFLQSVFIVLLVLVSSTACVARGGNYDHRSFHNRSIEEDGLAIVAVVSAQKNIPTYENLDWSKRLENSVRVKHDQYPLVSAVSIKNALAKNYTTVLGNYRKYGDLDRESFALIRKAPIVARFGMFVRIERDQVYRPPRKELPVKNAQGEIMTDRVMLVLSSQRIMAVSASVYDLKTGRIVWRRVREVSPQNNASYVDYRGKSFAGALTVATLNTVNNGTISRKPPDYPSRNFTLKKAMDDIASQLPGTRFE